MTFHPAGPRACYDEGKRVSETLSYAYFKQENVSVRVARIFNTYGPRMNLGDGRVVSNFILQALRNESITVSGILFVSINFLHRLCISLLVVFFLIDLWKWETDAFISVRI